MRLVVLSALILIAGSAAAQPLRAPFDVAGSRAGAPIQRAAEPCPALVPPLVAPPGNPFYADNRAGQAFAVPDAALQRQNEEAVRPLRAYAEIVTRQANGHLRTGRPEAARCALAHLDAWARAGALLGQGHPTQGAYERKWSLAAVALAYLQIRDAEGLDASATERVRAWFRALAGEVRAYYDRPPGTSFITDRLNNHMTWAGLAVGAAAVAIDDRALFDWAMSRARLTLSQVSAQGRLPREMGRGAKALHYHVFTLGPLAVLARLAAANGVDLDTAALDRLARATATGVIDPAAFAPAGGTPQEAVTPTGATAAAFHAWGLTARVPELEAALSTARHARFNWLGGDAALLYRAR